MSEEQKRESSQEANEANSGNGTAQSAADSNAGDEMTKALEAAQKELLYLRADFENTKKRMVREQEQAIKFSQERVFRELLGVVDLFDRGLEMAPRLRERLKGDTETLNFVTGMELTHRELVSLLTKFGGEFIGTPGEAFDPNRHEAISQEETTDASKDGTVLRVLQRGCLLHGRLLSPARVVVAKLP